MVLPLSGMRIVDLTKDFAGPFCTMMLSDLGAEVIKIERPGIGDETRAWGPPFPHGTSYYFHSLNRGKKSVVLDLARADHRDVIRKLVADSDVFVESNRPGSVAKYHLDYPTIRRVNHSIVYCSISGFGQTGPYHDRPGYDIVAYAMSGIMNSTGEAGSSPIRMAVPVADISAGHYACTAILAALSRRLITGQGEYVDVSLLDSIVSWLTYLSSYYYATQKEPEKMGSAHASIVPYQAFHCKDRDLIVAVGNDAQWKSLCRALGLKDLQSDPKFTTNPSRVKNREVLIRRLSNVFATKISAHWLKLLLKNDVPATLVYKISEITRDSQMQHRKVFQNLGDGIPQIASPMRFSKLKPVKSRNQSVHVPRLGEHTRIVLGELGYSRKEQARILGSP